MPDQHAVLGDPVGDGPLGRGGRRVDGGQVEGAEVVGAARVAPEVGDGVDVVRLVLPVGERLALLGEEGGEPAVAGGLGQDAVGDQGLGAQGAQGEAEAGGAYGVGTGRAGFGDQAYDGVPVGEDGLYGGQFDVPAGRGLVQPVGGHGDAGQPAEDGAQGAGRLPLGREQTAQVAAQLLGEGEQGEGLRQGREVDDEEVVALAEGGVPQGAQEGQLPGAGQRGDLLGVQPGGAEQVQDVRGAALEGGEVLAEAFGGVRAPGGEVRGGLDGGRSGRGAQCGAQGVGVVGAEQEGAGAVGCGAQCGGGSDGRTTAAAWARDQDGAHEAERYRRARVPDRGDYFSPDSTLFFRPARARSMMTFSALRLIMPSMGILTSTVRR